MEETPQWHSWPERTKLGEEIREQIAKNGLTDELRQRLIDYLSPSIDWSNRSRTMRKRTVCS
jgi:hypothetical protein